LRFEYFPISTATLATANHKFEMGMNEHLELERAVDGYRFAAGKDTMAEPREISPACHSC